MFLPYFSNFSGPERTPALFFQRKGVIMTQIMLVRHGQTPWNKDKIFRGSKDIPLNDQGRDPIRP
jgi:hypothetical protein